MSSLSTCPGEAKPGDSHSPTASSSTMRISATTSGFFRKASTAFCAGFEARASALMPVLRG